MVKAGLWWARESEGERRVLGWVSLEAQEAPWRFVQACVAALVRPWGPEGPGDRKQQPGPLQ